MQSNKVISLHSIAESTNKNCGPVTGGPDMHTVVESTCGLVRAVCSCNQGPAVAR